MTEREISSATVALGFLVVILAGLSTGIGAAVVYFPKLVKLASRRVLASALGISAGVMTYVSFVEIFLKSVDSFDESLAGAYEDEDKRLGMANLYATLSFFGGVALNAVSLTLHGRFWDVISHVAFPLFTISMRTRTQWYLVLLFGPF